jgi:hypothetical protein
MERITNRTSVGGSSVAGECRGRAKLRCAINGRLPARTVDGHRACSIRRQAPGALDFAAAGTQNPGATRIGVE